MSGELKAISQVVWNPASLRTLCNSLTEVVTSRQLKASHRWYEINYIGLANAEITPEQGASKIVKLSKQMAKLCWKLKWLLYFWDTVYILCLLCI